MKNSIKLEYVLPLFRQICLFQKSSLINEHKVHPKMHFLIINFIYLNSSFFPFRIHIVLNIFKSNGKFYCGTPLIRVMKRCFLLEFDWSSVVNYKFIYLLKKTIHWIISFESESPPLNQEDHLLRGWLIEKKISFYFVNQIVIPSAVSTRNW